MQKTLLYGAIPFCTRTGGTINMKFMRSKWTLHIKKEETDVF